MEIEVGQRDGELLMNDIDTTHEIDTHHGMTTIAPEATLEEVRKRIRDPNRKAPFSNSISLLSQIGRRDKVLTPY
jgi:predicted small metal-binding protein